MRKVINIATTVVFVLVLIFVFLLFGMRLFGVEPYTVISGSMEPEYHVGSLIYVKKANPEELKEGVVITYKLKSGTVVTHRIVEVDDSNPANIQYVTKGDANKDKDGTPVSYSQIIGRPVFTIPILGYVCYVIQNPPGTYIVVGALFLFVLIAFLPDIFKLFRKGDNEEDEDKEKEKAKQFVDNLNEIRSELIQKSEQLSKEAPPSSQNKDGNENA